MERRLVLSPPRWVAWRATATLVILAVAFLATLLRPSPARLLALVVVFVLVLPVMLAQREKVVIDVNGVRRGRRRVGWDDVVAVDTAKARVTTRRRPIRLPGRIEPADLRGLVPPHIEVT